MVNDKGRAAVPVHPLEQDAFIEIQRTADALERGVADVLKPAGLTVAQFNVLRILRGSGSPGATCWEVGDRMISRDPDVTRLVDRLQKRGLVARDRGTRDRRVVHLHITEEGLRLLATLDEVIVTVHRAQLGHVGKDRLEQIVGLMRKARLRPDMESTRDDGQGEA